MLSPILHPASGLWMLGKIEHHTASPLSREEIEQHILLVDAYRKRDSEITAALGHERALIDHHIEHFAKAGVNFTREDIEKSYQAKQAASRS